MLSTSFQENQQEVEMLALEHNHAVEMLAELQATLEDEYEKAYEMLMAPPEDRTYTRPFTLNIGLIHNILKHIQETCELVTLMKSSPPKSLLFSKRDNDSRYQMSESSDQSKSRIKGLSSIYLTCKHEIKNSFQPKPDELEPETFLNKYRMSTEIKLRKAQMKDYFLNQADRGCHNVYTITLESDPLDIQNQIEDPDIRKFSANMFRNLSTLNIPDSSITDSSIEQLKVRFPNVKHLNLSGCYMLTDRAIKILADEMGENFVSLTLNSMNSIRQESFFSLIETSINLNYLSLRKNPNIPQDYYLKVYQIYRYRNGQLKWLQITNDYGIDLFINKLMYMTSTNTIEQITDQQFKTLVGEDPPPYTGIFFQNCQELTKASLDIIMSKCRNVRKLGLSKYLHLNDSWLRDLTLCLRGLQYLDLNCCYNVTDNGLYHVSENLVGENLEYLVLERCLSITDEGLKYILDKNSEKFLNQQQKQQQNKMIHSSGNSKKQHNRLAIPTATGMQRSSSSRSLFEQRERNESQNKVGALRYLSIAHCKKITDKSLNLLSTTAESLQILDISFCDQITDQPIQLISQRLINIKSLNLNYCESLTDSSISMLATRLINNLEYLEIQWCEVSQSCIRYIAENLVHLKVLNLSYCPSVVSEEIEIIATNMPHLEILKLQACDKISQAALIKLATSLQNLRVITLKQVNETTDIVVKLLTEHNKKLQHLDISWCTQLTDKSLFAIAKNCYCLKVLNLNGCVEITDEGLEWLSTTVSNIQYLNLTLCSKITDAGVLQITSHLKQLKNLYLAELELLTDSSITSISNLTKLEQLVLKGCTGITSSSLIGLLYNLQKLTDLNISQCRSIDGENLWKICQFMANIKILQISEIQIYDEFLNELSLHCLKLKYLNLCYCNNISDTAVLTMMQKLPRLVKIGIQNTKIHDRTIGKIFHALNSRKMEQIVLE